MIEDEFHIIDVQKYKLSPNDFDSKMNNLHDKSLSISHVNIRSSSKNISELQLLYDHSLKFNLILLSYLRLCYLRLEKVNVGRKNVVIIGDFNIDVSHTVNRIR